MLYQCCRYTRSKTARLPVSRGCIITCRTHVKVLACKTIVTYLKGHNLVQKRPLQEHNYLGIVEVECSLQISP